MIANSGGRVSYSLNSQVRILCCDGKISKEVYMVETDRSDRKGHVALKEIRSNKQIKVQYRRILPVSIEGQAAVIESGGKFRAICPDCNYIETVDSTTQNLNCSVHGKKPLYWLGEKPMAEATVQSEIKSDAPTLEKKSNKPEQQKPAKIDLNALAAMPNCELWTRKYVKFDHPSMNVQCHTLLYTGENPRKFCFNSYNGTVGKKAISLPFEEFLKDAPVQGAKKERPWYPVPDLEKARAKLIKDNYEKH